MLCILFLIACQNNSEIPKSEGSLGTDNVNLYESEVVDIPYIVAKNYFVKNSVESIHNPKIETAEKFEEIFGMATTMGEDGKPTEIDFSKYYVIAVVLPATDISSKIIPVSLQKHKDGKIVFLYKKYVGTKQSFKTRESIQIIVDKNMIGEVDCKEIN